MLALMARAAVPTTWLFCALAFLFAMIADTADLQTLTSGGYPQVLLRAPQIGPWILGAVLTVIVGVYRIGGAVSRSAGELVITLLVATGLMVACCWMSLRCGYLVTPTEVVSREGALWKPDVRLPLDRLVRVETGCTVHHGRSASYSPVMVVVFRSGVRRSEDTVKLLELAQANGARLIPDADIAAVDLGDWVDGRHLAKWTEGMARVAQLPQFRNAQWMPDTDAATGRCIDKLVGPLDADHRAQLLDLLGYR
jgi:hypothetical protein